MNMSPTTLNERLILIDAGEKVLGDLADTTPGIPASTGAGANVSAAARQHSARRASPTPIALRLARDDSGDLTPDMIKHHPVATHP